VESKDFAKNVGASGLMGEKGFSVSEQLWDAADARTHGIWGGLHGRRLEDRDPSRPTRNFRRASCPIRILTKSRRLLERHIRKLLPKTVKFKLDVHSKGKAWLRPTRIHFLKWRTRRLKRFCKPPVFIREGGPIPFVTQM